MLSGCYEVFVERLLLFLLGCLLCLLSLLRFLGHVALRGPKSWFNASRQSTCMHSEYTTIAKLIRLASKRVNDRHAVASCDRTKPSRDAWTQRDLPDQDGKKLSHDRQLKPTTAKPNHPLARVEKLLRQLNGLVDHYRRRAGHDDDRSKRLGRHRGCRPVSDACASGEANSALASRLEVLLCSRIDFVRQGSPT